MKNYNVHLPTAGNYRPPLFLIAVMALGLNQGVQAQDFEVLLGSSGEVKEAAYEYLRKATFGSDQVYEKIRGPHLKQLMGEVVGFSRMSHDDGNRYWGRISGTKYEAMTADWIGEKFSELGLENIHTQAFDLRPQWFPIDWSLTAIGDGTTLNFASVNPATRTPGFPEAMELEAIWVGLGTEADFIGRNVQGKAVIIQSMLAPGQMGNSASWEGATLRARDKGAAMIIGIWGYAGNLAVWQSLNAFQMIRNEDGSSRYVNQQLVMPGFFMGWEDGQRLRDLVATGGSVKISATLETETREGLISPSIFGTLPGTTDEKIYVMAHMDGYYDAALDNASGVAVMLSLAEYFAQIPAEQRRRDIVFIGTAGHHVGSPNAIYLRDEGLLENTALMINCEHIAPTQFVNFNTEMRRSTTITPRRWWVHGSQRLLDITLDAYRTFGVSLISPMDGRATGEMMAIDKEAPSLQVIRSPEHKHTDGDIMELVPGVGVEAVARSFAKIIDEVNKLDISQLSAAVAEVN